MSSASDVQDEHIGHRPPTKHGPIPSISNEQRHCRRDPRATLCFSQSLHAMLFYSSYHYNIAFLCRCLDFLCITCSNR